MREKDREVAATSQAVRAATRSIASAQQALAQLQARKALLITQRSAQARSISEHLAAAYRLNSRDLVKQVLNQENADEVERMLRYHKHFSGARVQAVQAFQETVAELDQNARELATEQAELSRRQQTLKREETALLAGRAEQRAAITELQAEKAGKTEQRKLLLADRQRLESLLSELRKRSIELDGTGFVANKGKLAVPITARIDKAYGSKRSDGELTWNGVLFNAAIGTNVQAVFEGEVVFADWLRGYGLLMILDHGGGYMTLYGHADSLSKSVGDRVRRGETIASAGRSGGQTSSGLYFEVRYKGKTVDPILWLARKG